MKRIISILLTLILVMSCTSFVFADSNTSKNTNYIIPVVIDQPYDPFGADNLRNDNIPSVVYSLQDVSYSGQANFSSSVYTNCLFSDHYGTIMLYIASSNTEVSDPDLKITVWICKKGIFNTEITVQTKYAPVNGYAQLMFSGLNPNTNYFFHFAQNIHSETTSYFSVGRIC